MVLRDVEWEFYWFYSTLPTPSCRMGTPRFDPILLVHRSRIWGTSANGHVSKQRKIKKVGGNSPCFVSGSRIFLLQRLYYCLFELFFANSPLHVALHRHMLQIANCGASDRSRDTSFCPGLCAHPDVAHMAVYMIGTRGSEF